LFVERWSCYVDQAGLKLKIFLPQPLIAGITGMHNTWPNMVFLRINPNPSKDVLSSGSCVLKRDEVRREERRWEKREGKGKE
jgi:hypothetical protein